MLQDLVVACRTLRGRGAALTTATLALGMAFAIAMFAVGDAVLFKPLPYASPDDLVFVWDRTSDRPLTNLTPARLIALRERLQNVTGLAGIGHLSFTLTGRGNAERLAGASVSSNFFEVLGVEAARGRVFRAADTDRRLVVLGDALWRRRFAADPQVVGAAVTLDGVPHTITGVMPPSFYWTSITVTPSAGPHPELWAIAPPSEVPARPGAAPADPRADRRTGYLRGIARVKPGVTLADAEAEAASVSQQLEAEFPATDRGRRAIFVSAHEQLLGHARLPVLLLVGASVLLLVGACVNVANLRLMRLSGRRRDFAVQAALGASPIRIIRQLAAESSVAALAAGSIALGLAAAALPSLRAVVPMEVPRLSLASVDARAVLAAMVCTFGCAMGLSLLQALAIRRLPSVAGGERSQTTKVRATSRRALVAIEVAAAVVLVTGALLFTRSLEQLQRVDIGIRDVDRLLTFNVVLSGERRGASHAQRVAFFEDVLARVRALPSVEHAAAAATLPVGGDDFGTSVSVEGGDSVDPRPAGYQVVGHDWFATLGIQRLAGRDFTAADDGRNGRVAIVNQTFAAERWPGRDPVGRRLRMGREGEWLTVVGLVADIRHRGPQRPARPEVYEPHYQTSFSFTAVAVRTSGDPLAIVEPIRAEIARLDATQPISTVATMEEHLLRTHAETRSLSSLTSVLGVMALIIAALGIYGAMAFGVAQRTRELGVRLALGATPRELGASVVREALGTASIGLGVGALAAFAAARAAKGVLFGVPPSDPIAFAGAAGTLLAVAVLAAYVPARRAMAADPSVLLRTE